jgi:hypothetical protein
MLMTNKDLKKVELKKLKNKKINKKKKKPLERRFMIKPENN